MAESDSTLATAMNLTDLLGRFSDDIALLSVVYRSLRQQEAAPQEQIGLELIIARFESLYRDLDSALVRLAQRPRESGDLEHSGQGRLTSMESKPWGRMRSFADLNSGNLAGG